MKKAQISLEMVFSVGAILFIAMIVLLFGFAKKGEIIKTEQFTEARAECFKLAEALGSVLTLGTDANLTLNFYYLHNIQNNSVILTMPNSTASPLHEIATCNYIGNVGPYSNITGTVVVRNILGNISLYEVF